MLANINCINAYFFFFNAICIAINMLFAKRAFLVILNNLGYFYFAKLGFFKSMILLTEDRN